MYDRQERRVTLLLLGHRSCWRTGSTIASLLSWTNRDSDAGGPIVPAALVRKVRLARRGLLVVHPGVSRAHELGGEPVGPPLVVDDDAAARRSGVGRLMSPRGPR